MLACAGQKGRNTGADVASRDDCPTDPLGTVSLDFVMASEISRTDALSSSALAATDSIAATRT